MYVFDPQTRTIKCETPAEALALVGANGQPPVVDVEAVPPRKRPPAPTLKSDDDAENASYLYLQTLVKMRQNREYLSRERRRFFVDYGAYAAAKMLKEHGKLTAFALAKHFGASNGKGSIWIRQAFERVARAVDIPFSKVFTTEKHKGETYWTAGERFDELITHLRTRAYRASEAVA